MGIDTSAHIQIIHIFACYGHAINRASVIYKIVVPYFALLYLVHLCHFWCYVEENIQFGINFSACQLQYKLSYETSTKTVFGLSKFKS